MKTVTRFACFIAALFAAGAQAQTWPAKPMRIYTVAAGGPLDIGARLVGQAMSQQLGQPIVIENRPPSSRFEQQLLKSPPDGYTLMYWANPMWLSPFLQNVNYDPIRDFAPISLVARGLGVVVVHPSVQARSLKELVDLAKARPGQLNIGVTSPGSSAHLAAVLFRTQAGFDAPTVFYKASPQSVNDLIAGRVQFMLPTLASVLPHIKSGKLRALAITTAEPSELLPGVPPVGATYPGFDQGTVHALFAAANTPAAIINRLNQETVKAVRLPEVREKLVALAVDVVGSTPEQLAAAMKSDMERTGKVIRDNNIRAEE